MMETFASAEGKALLFSRRRLFSIFVAAQDAGKEIARSERDRQVDALRPPLLTARQLGVGGVLQTRARA
jgi:hypothetical protein